MGDRHRPKLDGEPHPGFAFLVLVFCREIVPALVANGA
jgi:hypothetical protein